MKKKHSRKILTAVVITILTVAMAYAFWPQPTLVDIGIVQQGEMTVTLDEEARTQVHDTYTVSAPITGRLLRINVEPGDKVIQQQTVIAQMLPAYPPALDTRAIKQAQAAISAAEASLRAVKANVESAIANKHLADSHLKRSRAQHSLNVMSDADYEQAQQSALMAEATLNNANAAVGVRVAELNNARAALIAADVVEGHTESVVSIKAPITGQILNVMQKSEAIMTAGMPIMEVGDVDNDLEVVVELLSSDAVKVKVGQSVIIDNWGGSSPLAATVSRIDPYGYTKFSALGVEEQRVNAVIQFDKTATQKQSLGHGFRVDARIVIWQNKNVTKAPASALFRQGEDWVVFVVKNNIATIRKVIIGHNNGTIVSIREGLELDDRVILYPSADLKDGTHVAQR